MGEIVLIGLEHLQALGKKLEKAKNDYLADRDIQKLSDNLHTIAKTYKHIKFAFAFFIKQGEELIESGERECGFSYFLETEKHIPKNADDIDDMGDTVYLFLRLAEHYLEKGEAEKGINYLIRLCTETTSNYEESIELRDLTQEWEKYKHLVAGMVPESVIVNGGVSPIAPENCSMKIDKILSLPQEDLLTEISQHLNEMSGNGSYLNYLNKWEKLVYDADLLCAEINSGGFSHYLYYNGNRFQNAIKAFETINSQKMLNLMNMVKSKFPKNKIPKSIDSIQNKIDIMEDNDIDFDEEDNIFYDDAQVELLDKLYEFIIDNKKHFR